MQAKGSYFNKNMSAIVTVALASALVVLYTLFLQWYGVVPPRSDTNAGDATVVPSRPLGFEPNVGQADPSVLFTLRAPGGAMQFTRTGVSISVASSAVLGANAQDLNSLAQGNRAKGAVPLTPEAMPGGLESSAPNIPDAMVNLEFLGAGTDVQLESEQVLPGKVNYFLGSDPANWHSDLSMYGQIRYNALYKGTDLIYRGDKGNLKGTYVLAPGADPGLIRWRYNGAGNPKPAVSAQGALQIEVGGAVPFTIEEHKPEAWQEIDGARVTVPADYRLAPDGSVGFAVGAYDKALPLTIDPDLTYSTYLGGNFAETGYSVAVDPAGNFYVSGYTNSSNFPTPNGLQPNFGGGGQDGYVAKFNADGQPVYITYLGGSNIDSAQGIDADADGNAYITGFTSSANFPVHNALQPALGGSYDAFVAKLNPAGSALVFSTYLGGSGSENSQGSGPQSGEIAVDAGRSIYVAGYTTSTNFPVHNALQPGNNGGTDLFLTKLVPDGSATVFSTYLGGSDSDGTSGIALDGQNNIGLAGYSWSQDFPTQAAFRSRNAGLRDAFITKVNAAGSALIFSTYLGGVYDDMALDVDLDSAGNVYAAGFTDSLSFPLVNAYDSFFEGLSEAFVAKFTPAGVPLFSTYLGGNWLDTGMGVAANDAGETFVMGSTQSQDFPLMDPIDPLLSGTEDVFVTRFNSTGTGLIFSTYLGGSNQRELQNGGALTIDSSNNIYVSGDTGADDFPTTANAFQLFRASAVDAFVSRISEHSPTPTATSTGSPQPSPTACVVGNYQVAPSAGATLVPGTTYLPNSACDNCTAPIAFPFPVKFYDQTFTQGRVSSEGLLQFTTNNPLNSNFCLPYGGINNAIFAFWDDLYIGSHGVYTSLSGSAPNRIFNIEWRGELALTSEPVDFEIRLYEGTGQIDTIYAQTGSGSGDSATVGVQRDTGSLVTQFSCNQPMISPGTKLTFALPPCLTPTATPAAQTPSPTPSPTSEPPAVLSSTYYGSDRRDSIDDVAKDSQGNIYLAGTTFQSDIDYGDIFISKFSPDCQQLLWTVILGGTRVERAYSIAVDPAGNATISGIATSNDYPTLNPLQANHAGGIYDVVLTKVSPAGTMLWSTYLGGNDLDYGIELATNSAGDLYLAGQTESSNFPTTSGAFQTSLQGVQDGYVAKINANGSALLWSTYLGGQYADGINAIALDAQGNVYATGKTVSPNFPTLNPFQATLADSSGDAFVTKLNPTGSALLYSTYLGGSHSPGPGEDVGYGIAVDGSGSAYVTGVTESPNFPTTLSSFEPYFRGVEDAFVTKLVPAGNNLVYSTFLGGTARDDSLDIALNNQGQAYVTGFTESADFPTARPIQPLKQDRLDAFVTRLNAAGTAPVYSTYLGGDAQIPNAVGDDGASSLLLDSASNVVVVGTTSSYNFPVLNAYQGYFAGDEDGFIARISNSAAGPTPTPVVSATATAQVTATRTSTVQVTSSPTSTAQATASSTAPVTTTPTTTATGTITVSPSATLTACAISFSDVPEGSTFYTYIQCLACRGIVTGYPDGTFRPASSVSRGQLSKIIANSAGFNEPVTGQTFTDVPPGSTFYEYIERLASRRIVDGYPDGTFRPADTATRGQISKIVANSAGFNEPVTGQTFTDVLPGSTFYEYIERLASRRIVGGYPDGTFRPATTATRGQMSKMATLTFFPECAAR